MTDYRIEDNTINIVNPQGAAANTDVSGIVEFAADFQPRLVSLVQASLSKRPDSIALDYLTAFCLGPVANGDSSEGAVSYVWKCRVDNDTHQILIARENDTRDGWLAETELFTFDDGLAEINEVDIAFEQASRPVICASRNTGTAGTTEVWLYWFDSTDSTFGFDNFGAGRTPRVILDAPFNITDSDVLFFYLTDTKLVYRQQKDRYGVVLETPLNIDSNAYIEDVVKLRSGRVRIELIRRNAVSGKYSIDALTSTLYPVLVGPDNATTLLEFQSGTLIVVIIDDILKDIDELDASFTFIYGILVGKLILVELFDKDSIDTNLIFVSGSLIDPTIIKILYDIDSIDPSFSFVSGTMPIVVITHIIFDISEIDTSLAFVSGTLEIV